MADSPPDRAEPTGTPPAPRAARAGEARTEAGRSPLLTLVIMLVLAGGCLALIEYLMDASRRQDCILSGRRNCGDLIDWR